MNKNLRIPTVLRWTVFLTLLVFITGCAQWDFFRWLTGDPAAPEPGGCRGRTFESFGPYGYESIMGYQPGPYGIYPRDMGIALDLSEYRLINPRESSN